VQNRNRTFVRFLYYTAKFAVCQPFFKIFLFFTANLGKQPSPPQRANIKGQTNNPFWRRGKGSAPKGLSKKYALQAKIMPPVFSLSFQLKFIIIKTLYHKTDFVFLFKTSALDLKNTNLS